MRTRTVRAHSGVGVGLVRMRKADGFGLFFVRGRCLVGRGSFGFDTGRWVTVAQRIKLNDVGQSNG